MRETSLPWMAAVLVVALAIAGCTQSAPDEPAPGDDPDEAQTLYEHRWSYGPASYGTQELPRFQDAFQVPEGLTEIEVSMAWEIDQGQAAVLFAPPGDRAQVNLTSAEHGGPAGQGQANIDPASGTWGFEIPTWRGEDGTFPSGHIHVVVTGR